ncbi:MAG TPA: flagellar hook protein FlgE [Burkholderiaceae bacterium]|nr:flagellar hook protein FlgE [Burkholderiaceae bacterium]
MSFQHGLSGLNAAARNLDVIGNNVANANTVGAKSSRAEFADLYANSLTGLSASTAGIGVAVTSIAQQFTQGDIVSTNNPLDMAINGRGFFRTTIDGAIQYTRNGQFRMDKDGYIVNAQGARLNGFQVDANGQTSNGTPTPLRISTADIQPRATAAARAQVNLDARDDAITAPFSSANPDTYNNAMSMMVYDSLGRDHQVTLFYRKTAGNTWEVRAQADGTDIAGVPATLNFDSAGRLTSPTGPFNLTIPVGADAGGTQTFTIDLTSTTQFGGPFGTTEINQDGYSSGRLSGFTADDSGMLIGRYSNGQSRPQGQILLANFVNPQGLVPLGNNAWVESGTSGQPTLGTPGSGILGSLESASVENSNVDMTAELVNMITAQRTYQANAQTIKTHDQLLQTIVNLR